MLANPKLNTIKVFIFMALIDSNITHHEFVSLINVKKYDGMKREFKSSNNK